MTRTSISAPVVGRDGSGGRAIGRGPALIVSSMAAALLVAVMLTAVIFARHGVVEGSAIRALQITARWSFLLFWFAYAGGAAARLFGPPLTGLARYGREFGLAFASAQLVHVGLVLWLSYVTTKPVGGMVFFWVGILCVYLLALFSLPALRNALGARFWQTFHTAALEYIALAFATDFILLPLNALGNDLPNGLSAYPLNKVLFAIMVVGGLALRLVAFARYRNDTPAKERQLSSTAIGAGLLLFASIGLGLWDLFHSLHALAAFVASMFVIAGIFSTWRCFSSN